MVRIEGYVAGIVEQFGRFTRMLKPGFNIINPCSEEVLEVDMRLNSEHLGKQMVITKDNITLTV
jgi:regulator of protease activity HflC (stomatin/prohibitin superfamily)